jgi:hypothetical protein
LNLYSNQRFEFEFAFEFGTYILHISWSLSQTNDLSASVRTFFKKRTPCHLPLSPCKRASYHIYFVAIILSADKNDQNEYPSCGKAITTSDSTWENGCLLYLTMTDILSTSLLLLPLRRSCLSQLHCRFCICWQGGGAEEGPSPLTPNAPPWPLPLIVLRSAHRRRCRWH